MRSKHCLLQNYGNCGCKKHEYLLHVHPYTQWQRQDFCLGEAHRGAEGDEGLGAEDADGLREGVFPPHRGRSLGKGLCPSQLIFDYLILKWRILMHI